MPLTEEEYWEVCKMIHEVFVWTAPEFRDEAITIKLERWIEYE